MAAPARLVRDLPRRLGVLDATAIVVGIVIGSGIFVLPNVIARSVPSYAGIVAAWLIGGVLSFFGALAYAELGAMLPATGGQYVYLREAYGPMCAFVCGWTFMLAVLAGGSAWMAVTFSIYLGYFVPLTPVAAKAIAVVLIAVLSAVNYVGVKEGAWVQRTFTCLKVVALVILIGAAFFSRNSVSAPAIEAVPSQSGFAHFGVAMAACLMAYNGWSYVSFVAGEVRNPERNLLRSLVIGMAVVAVLYISANLAYLKVMTIPEIAAAERVGADVATRTMGSIGGTFVSLAVLLSIIGAINGCILTGARIPFAQARDGLFFAARRNTSAISDARVRHRVRRNLDGGSGGHGIVRDTVHVLDTGCVDLLYDERGGSDGAAPQTARRGAAIPDVGLSVDALAVRGGVRMVHGRRGGDAAAALRHGAGDCGDRRASLLDVAQVVTDSGLTQDNNTNRAHCHVQKALRS
jgi:APA family basic amino acid/polyamine antiporter